MDEKMVLRLVEARYEGALRDAQVSRMLQESERRVGLGERLFVPFGVSLIALGRAIVGHYQPVLR